MRRNRPAPDWTIFASQWRKIVRRAGQPKDFLTDAIHQKNVWQLLQGINPLADPIYFKGTIQTLCLGRISQRIGSAARIPRRDKFDVF